ncbi:uncharacterized protein RHOBADRAFT_53238 [Rhodotorula graminis WP1]|uniref:Plus3 domain-containing protein n=1 Tax=Rhodotorula graminis (strain WP1) TaxID=578459 RepID=A0A194S3Y5_RHOGW|nr:uncharacterized protein RHOBADRAFT_53238 [Rhodotorula graminis WP1]KPV75234.1 hypothetical protein RHOBADRAFT_53238 [Rhodotorula graminis WP1]
MDFEEELLGLTGGGAASSKRTKASKGSKSRRKRAKSDSEDGSASDMDLSESDSDAAPAASTSRGGSRRRGHKSAERVDTDEDESDEDEGRKGGAAKATDENPYPVEGIYKDTAERSRISKLPELEREDFIATRKEEINERVMRAEVAKLARASDARRGGAQDDDEGDDDDDDDDDDEYGGARETRSRKVTGATKTKSEGLEKLKRSRAEKGKKRDKADSSDDDYEEPGRKKNRKASPSSSASSDMDVATSDEDDAPSSKAAAAAAKKKGKKAGPEPLGPSELRDITVPRAKLAEMCRASWFGEWLVGAFVRVTVGPNKDDPQAGNKYRVAQVTGLKKAKEPYRVEAVMTEHDLELTIGTDKARFPMASVSNGPLTDSEYAHYVRMCQTPKTAPPTSKEAAKIKAQLAKHTTYILTEEDLQKQLEASGSNKRGPGAKTRMKIQRDHAVAAGDQAEVDRLNRELAALDAPTGAEQDRARMINERNRANNREEVRKAEAKAQDFRRKQAELLARGDTDVRVDPSARVKTMPRLNYDSSRPQTPGPGSGAATPTKGGPLAAANAAAANAETPRQRGSKIELASQVAINVDDLLDF